MSTQTTDQAAADYAWDRRYDARDGVREAIRTTLAYNANVRTGTVNRWAVREVIDSVLGAVAPERRGVLTESLIDAFDGWLKVPSDDKPAKLEAHKPFGRLLDDAAHAQISGTVFHFGGAR